MVNENPRKYVGEDIKSLEIAARVKDLLTEKGWSQADLMRAAGISRSLASRLTSAVRTPSSTTISKLAKALGVSADYLISGGERQTAESLAPDVVQFVQSYWSELDHGDKTLLRVTIGHLAQKVEEKRARERSGRL